MVAQLMRKVRAKSAEGKVSHPVFNGLKKDL
jgi:hypothetical protein